MIDFILEFFISFFTYKADAIYAVTGVEAALIIGGLNFLSQRSQAAKMRANQRRMDALTQQQLEEARAFRDEQMKLLAVEKENLSYF